MKSEQAQSIFRELGMDLADLIELMEVMEKRGTTKIAY
jgi:antitoxin component of RelBE/YafQ-DinJ toxin-antitoxin module